MVASDGSSFLLGVGDGPCGDLEDDHQETEGVARECRCGNALLRHMLLTELENMRNLHSLSCSKDTSRKSFQSQHNVM